MRRIDKLFLECPFYGSRQMVRHLWREGVRASEEAAISRSSPRSNSGSLIVQNLHSRNTPARSL